MRLKRLRIGIALILLGFLFVFFVPLVYDATMFQCAESSFVCLTNPSGLKSLGYALFHWGGAYSFGEAGDSQLLGYAFLPEGYFSYPGTSGLTSFGVLLLVAFPITVACVGLLAPEIIRKSRVMRIGFVGLGAVVFVLHALFFLSMISEGFNLTVALLGAVLAATGGTMVLYGLRPGFFTPTT
ncbi:MAG: hypothetical protein LYZ69_08805 [Nitrososphaerales archaeon]|nr:hypothetical protein [Nitrososphaerales archaeon]